MREIGITELKKVQMDILLSVHKFCQSYNISYSLACGTMLGAARHKGYIPWDDDIDIYILRKEYETFTKNFPSILDNKYIFLCLENNSKWHFPFGKVCDTTTVLQESGNEGNYGVNIDIFPIDNVPEDKQKWEKYDKTRRTLVRLYDKRLWCGKIPKYNKALSFPLNLKQFLRWGLLSIFSIRFYAKCVSCFAQRYNDKETSMVFENVQGIFQKHPFHKKLFSKTVLMPFEEYEFMAFSNYDEYLTNGFGDWRKLPPKEKQVSHHVFKAWWKS